MKKIAIQSLLAASVLGTTGTALAQNCPPGSWLCADVQIGGGLVQPPVVVTPPPPPPPPPPPIVVYQQQPPPVVVYQPPRVVVTTTPTYTYVQQPQTYGWLGERQQAVGIGAHIGGLALPAPNGSSSAGLGGFGLNLRIRTHPYFATELTADFFSGTDYNGDGRSEIPLTVNELFYFNPMNRFQVYGLVGVGGSIATVQYQATHGGTGTGNYGYIGGQLGIGFEWQITPRFSLFSDVRGFLRTRADSNASANPEFTRVDAPGVVETSNTSIGATFQAGAILYL